MRTIVPSYDAYFDIIPKMGEYMQSVGAVCRDPEYCFTIYHDGEYRRNLESRRLCRPGSPKSRYRSRKREMHMNEILMVQNLSKHYGALTAVKNVSFTVYPGEIFGILRPNGSGKTSTIESILGTRKRDGGKVNVLGLDPVADRRRLFQQVGVQFQDSS